MGDGEKPQKEKQVRGTDWGGDRDATEQREEKDATGMGKEVCALGGETDRVRRGFRQREPFEWEGGEVLRGVHVCDRTGGC